MADSTPGPYEPFPAPPPARDPYAPSQPVHPYGGYEPGYPVHPHGQGGHPIAPWGSPESFLGLPDGVVIASVGRRIGAGLLALPLCLLTLGIGYLVWGLIVWGKGTSPALQVLGMRAWKEERRAVAGWGDMALRNIVDYLISSVTCGISSVVSFILFLTDEPRHRSLADRIGGTVIVHDPHRRLP